MKQAGRSCWISTLALTSISMAVSMPARSEGSPFGDPGTLPVRPVARAGAPNVLVWMLDDVGFAQLGCYGGLVSTPNIDRVAAMGLRYGNYHTTPVCSASRAAFLTGRNAHTVHVGWHLVSARGLPGYDGLVPAAAGTIAENLRQGGYATFALGKWDHVLPTDMTSAGPFTYWPTHQGFDRFYGFLWARTDNWDPVLWDGITPIAKPGGQFYHLNHDLADQAIEMINSRSAVNPSPPFFLYWATGTAHAPHHAPADWIAKYQGKFDAGWDVIREGALKREVAEGVVPPGTKLAPRPEGMQVWKTLTPEQRRLYARQMEVFAAALSYADAQFGRIFDTLDARGELGNTIIIVTSDNGASAEGSPDGLYNEDALGSGHVPGVAENMRWYDKWGGPETSPHYAIGWAVAGDAPFRYYKGTTYEGGVHTPFIIAWPNAIAAHGEWRSQFVHISDVAPTILDAAGVAPAQVVNGVTQSAFDGSSFAYSFAHAAEPSHDRAQYFELIGNKGLWADGWKLVTAHVLKMWDRFLPKAVDEPWELYDLQKDPGETNNLAARYPAKVAELDRLFSEQAVRFNVAPIADLEAAAEYGATIKAEDFARRSGKWIYPAPVARIPAAVAPPITRRSYVMTADISLPSGDETGAIFAIGGMHSGISFYLKGGRPVFLLRSYSGEVVSVESPSRLPRGQSRLTLTVLRKPTSTSGTSDTDIAISSDDHLLASQTLHSSMPTGFFGGETFDLGRDDGSAVTEDYAAATSFPGKLSNIVFDFNEK